LRDACLDQVVNEYVFYVKLVEEINRKNLEDHEKRKAQWRIDRANYLERKASYEKKKLEHDEMFEQMLDMGDDVNAADDDDDDEERPTKKALQEPDLVSDVFPEFEPLVEVLNQMLDEDRVKTVEDLDIDYVPFDMAALTIPDDYYWERLSNQRWDVRRIFFLLIFNYSLKLLNYSTFSTLMTTARNGDVCILRGVYGKQLKAFTRLMVTWKSFRNLWILLEQKLLRLD
jgi:hypothetical protein